MVDKPEAADGAGAPLSRRGLLKGAGIAGAAATSAVLALAPEAARAQGMPGMPMGNMPMNMAPARVEAFETLTVAEAETLQAICARLIPSDENGPGATEAHAAHYIDRALTTALAGSRAAYSVGLEAVDAYAQAKFKKTFAQLPASSQDAILTDMEKNAATGFSPNAATFFNLLRTHTIEGMFCDPYYGGNADFAGWDLINYPGIRTAVLPEDQRMNPLAKRLHHSAYDEDMFVKGAAHAHNP